MLFIGYCFSDMNITFQKIKNIRIQVLEILIKNLILNFK
jgi:hypothetical protein